MKLSELRPCDCCGGPITSGTERQIIFRVVRSSLAVIVPKKTNQTLGLMQVLGGSLQIAEAMGPDAECIAVMGDEPDGRWDQSLVCNDCWCNQEFDAIRVALEKNNAPDVRGDDHAPV